MHHLAHARPLPIVHDNVPASASLLNTSNNPKSTAHTHASLISPNDSNCRSNQLQKKVSCLSKQAAHSHLTPCPPEDAGYQSTTCATEGQPRLQRGRGGVWQGLTVGSTSFLWSARCRSTGGRCCARAEEPSSPAEAGHIVRVYQQLPNAGADHGDTRECLRNFLNCSRILNRRSCGRPRRWRRLQCLQRRLHGPYARFRGIAVCKRKGNCCLQKEGELLLAKGRGIAACKRMLSPASCDALETDFNRDVEDDGDGGHTHTVRQIHLPDTFEWRGQAAQCDERAVTAGGAGRRHTSAALSHSTHGGICTQQTAFWFGE
jgi:hypothetical protein